LPSLGHFLYIPGILLMGLALGFRLGAKAAREEIADQKRKKKE